MAFPRGAWERSGGGKGWQGRCSRLAPRLPLTLPGSCRADTASAQYRLPRWEAPRAVPGMPPGNSSACPRGVMSAPPENIPAGCGGRRLWRRASGCSTQRVGAGPGWVLRGLGAEVGRGELLRPALWEQCPVPDAVLRREEP